MLAEDGEFGGAFHLDIARLAQLCRQGCRSKVATDTRVTVRNVGMLLTQRRVNVLGDLLFAFLVPRLMGPDLHGRYALVTSLDTAEYYGVWG